jgi:SAM-dependent methyltransferase
MSDPVADQYEAYPYPARNPSDERRRLIQGSPSHILEIDHYLYAGRRDFSHGFRALFAGGGTGDGAIMLAQQLTDIGAPAEIVHLDISAAARGIAEARARERGLANLRFVTGSLLDLDRLGLGRFDYIDCCGVLHHLEHPQEGLCALADALAEDGGIGMMVYGELGRTGVYHAQEMLRLLGTDEPAPTRIEWARRLLRQLPPTNWFRRNPFLADHLEGGESGVHDLLLHARDRAYRVSEVADLVAAAGLAIVRPLEPCRYDPASYLTDAALLKRLSPLDPIARAAFAELIAGNMKSHIAYLVPVARAGMTEALPSPDMIPHLRHSDGAEIAHGLTPGGLVKTTLGGLEFAFALPRRAGPILARIDGRRTLTQIREALSRDGHNLGEVAFTAEFDQMFRAFNGLNQIFLADRPLLRG